jgi:phage regulator Rha-like protein
MSELSLIPETLTMTSREIAELTGKRHDNVMADIRQMLSDLELHAPDFSGAYKTERGNEYEFFTLPKRETYILITGYSVTMRAKIIDRWQELETQVKGQYIAPQVLKDLIEGAAERAVENYKALDSVNFNMLKQDITIMDILACKAGHGPEGIKRLTVQLLRKYGRPDLIGMLEMLGEVSDYDQHQSWAAVEELAQSYLKELVAARKQAGKKPLPEPTPEELEAVSLNWRMKYMPYSLVTNPVFVTHLTSEVSAPVSAAKAFARNHINMSLNRVTGQTTATWNGSANLNQLLLAK